MTDLQVFENTAGQKTLLNPSLNETYHSRHGAIAESLHVFIDKGLRAEGMKQKKQIHIFEMGFGTGLNAALTLQALQADEVVLFETVEVFPLAFELVKQLEYDATWSIEAKSQFEKMHTVAWNGWQEISQQFKLKKLNTNLEAMEFEEALFDLVYFDAFAPDKQAHLWTMGIFEKLFKAMKPGGILVTYAAKGDVRRALLAAGFAVEKLEGPPFKRHMLRATKPMSYA
jgi:tRNA U34 5-methylaminomethyl-2-thiouridine-forming methyltransferase MnmC